MLLLSAELVHPESCWRELVADWMGNRSRYLQQGSLRPLDDGAEAP